MVTLFATWMKGKQRWKLREALNPCSTRAVMKRRRQYRQALLFVRVPESFVKGKKRNRLCKEFYAWQRNELNWPWPEYTQK